MTSAAPDRLGRTQLGEIIAGSLQSRITYSSESTVTAIVGEWGSGKSWLLREIVASIQAAESSDLLIPISVRNFNPWLYADEDSLFAGFAQLLLGEISSRRIRMKVAKALQLIGPSLKFGQIDLSDATINLASAVGYASDPKSIQGSVRKSLTKSGKQILVVLDDLDRLTPNELLMVFKLVRLLGDIGGIHYLLVYDESTLLQLLAATPIAAKNVGRARNYLEKIVSQKFSVPPMLPSQVSELGIERIFRQAAELDIPIPQDSASRFEWIFDQMMRGLLSNPRMLDQYASEVLTLPTDLFREVDFCDWCVTTFLRTSFPDVWKLIIQYRGALTGNVDQIIGGDKDALPDFTRQLVKLLSTRSQLVGVTDMIVALFPMAGLEHRSVPAGSRAPAALAANMCVGDARFFERYLWLSLPPGEISNEAIRSALKGISKSTPSDQDYARFGEILEASPLDVIDRVSHLVPADGISIPLLVGYLERYPPFNALNTTYGGSDRSIGIYRIMTILESASATDLAAIKARAMTLGLADGDLWLEISRRMQPLRYPNLAEALGDIQSRILDLLEVAFAELPTPGELTESQSIGFYFYRNARRDDFYRLGKEAVLARRWRADDTIGLALSVWTGERGSSIDSLNADVIEAVFGLEFLRECEEILRSEEEDLVGQSLPDNWSFDGVPPTLANTRLIAHAAVSYILANAPVEAD
ncbi:hypothetical protein B7R54_00995 [Subtercola boreus]|uniref:KAP NTPase domain-containing protein n=1 Tax=Subtercola boreus TaxID=120213 RepID=A0A3E0VDF6_9MICO|nr:P-loop NTPase fold protein [Subtercola boreus]RFA07946.1 hypothetical protein B7R54_00995 [Subtercola boreus]TQL55191.1 KAP-like P-loop domain-containing protein [Subtercola boreus]